MKYRLGEIAEITMGQSPKSQYYNNTGDGIPFLQGNRTFGFKKPTFDTYTTHITKTAKAGDVIMSVRAPVGDLNITPKDICIGRGVCSLRMKNGNQEFLYYMMKYYVNHLLKRESGTVFGSVNRHDIETLEIDIPEDENVQKKIARYLSMIDEKIELNSSINNNLEQQVTTVFYNMFGKYEQNSNTHKPLSTIAKFKYGTMPKKDKLGTGHYHAFSGYQIVGTYPEVMFDNPQLIIVARGVGGCGDVKYTPANCYLTNLSIAIITEKTMHDDYLYHYLRLHDTKIMNTGSAQPQITVATLKKFKIPIPPEEEMLRFSDFVQPFKQQYRNNQDENKLLSKLRDALLPKLMSGELDVSDIDL